MIFSRKRQDEAVSRQIVEYCQLIQTTVTEFRQMIDNYIDWDKQFKERSKLVHVMEHEADVLRRTIERAMFEGAFLPAYRMDYIALLERLDRVANKAEDAADMLYLVRPDIPEPIRSDFVRIADMTLEAFLPIPEAVGALLAGRSDVRAVESHVEGLESEIDKIQFQLIRKLFKDPGIEKVDAMCLKMLIDSICDVSDKIENVSDQMAIIAIKRVM